MDTVHLQPLCHWQRRHRSWLGFATVEAGRDASAAGTPLVRPRLDDILTHFINAQSSATLAVAAFLLTIAVMFMYRPFSQVEVGDSAVYDYIAQVIVRGQMPYRDEIDIKAPGSFYLSALAMAAGKVLGVRDIISARLLHILFAGLLSAIVYLVGEAYLRNRFAGLLAVLSILISPHFALWTVGGGQPKLPMILFGMLTLLLIAHDRPFLAGFCSMLSCLCWQPGLLFTGVAFLAFSRYLTNWRDARAVRVLAGAAIPLAAVLLYFYSRGALGDLWTWTVVFTYSIYARIALKGDDDSLRHMVNVTLRIYKVDTVLVVLSLLGFATSCVQRIRERLRGISALNSSDLFRDSIIIAPLVYFAACLIRFNAGPYLIPFVPFIGIFFGWSVVELVRIFKKHQFFGSTRVDLIPNIALVLLLSIAGYRGIAYRFESIPTLQAQDKRFETISTMLGADDTIYVHGTTEILVLLNIPNLNPFVSLEAGKDGYIAARTYGGSFAALVDDIESRTPKIVALSRLGRVEHRDELMRLVEQNYVRLDWPGYDIYVRKPQGPM